MDQNQPISPCNGDAISASVRIMARSLQHRRVAWMHDFRDSPTRRSSHSTNPEVERRRSRRDTAPPNFRVFKVNQPVLDEFFGVASLPMASPLPTTGSGSTGVAAVDERKITIITGNTMHLMTPPISPARFVVSHSSWSQRMKAAAALLATTR